MDTKCKSVIILVLLIIGFHLLFATKESFATNGNHGLKWALNIADSVRDASMPGAILVEILGSVDDNGEITESEYTNEWTFYYYLQSGENYESLGVTVYYNSSTFSWDPGGTICNIEVPSYKDAKPWVQKADNAVGGITFTYRGIQVFADYDDIYENAENTVYVYYHTPDGELEAYVILDADTEDILLVEKNP